VLSEGRTNRLVWEGGFFLVVLIAGMAILTRTLRHDTELRRRQQNFLAAVSHEFKSPLASMQLAAETLVLRSPEADAKRLGQRILEDCERLLRMVDNLLDTTRIEEGQHRLRTEKVNLAGAVAAIVESFEERAARHGVTIARQVPDALQLAIDRTALDTILRNLVDNALKACIAGDGQHVNIRLDQSGGRIELSVSDDGLGFAPDDATLMFEKFHRLGDELRRKMPGTGLGLYIVKRLADMSGASVQAESGGPGQGARVSVAWPSRGGE
jgi:signal transduction histidine kinase